MNSHLVIPDLAKLSFTNGRCKLYIKKPLLGERGLQVKHGENPFFSKITLLAA